MKQRDPIDPKLSVRLPATIEHLYGLLQPVLAYASAHFLDNERKSELEIALEEALVNIFSYAYPDNPGYVDITCRATGDRLVILIKDEGVPFAMESLIAPDTASDLDERKIGGLGVHLIKNLVDEVDYRRVGHQNLLELTFFFDPQKHQEPNRD